MKGNCLGIKMKETIISFVVPLLNEEQCVEELCSRIRQTAEAIGTDFEIVCVDDDSSDSTLQLLVRLSEHDPRVKIVSLSRTFGHQTAVMAGLHHTSGDCVVVMDGDLQDPPEVVAEMVEKWRQGFKVVYGVRRARKEIWLKRICYKMFYRIIRKMSPLDIPLDAGDFCLMDRRVLLEMRKCQEERPFVRGLRSWAGFKQTGVEYDRPARTTGVSKYGLIRLMGLAVNGLLSLSDSLLRFSTLTGLLVSLGSLLYGTYIAVARILIALDIIRGEDLIPGWATLTCAIAFLLGLQFMFLGVIGEYIGRIFMQTKGRPLYVVEQEWGFGDDQQDCQRHSASP